ncbi:MAG TPA: DUF5691 domain-containing protein [Verrucomicrobiae bacterium]
MTVSFQTLVQVALLGTERQSPPEISAGPTSLGQLQQQAVSPNREQTLLSLAALTGVHERIGSVPPSEAKPAVELAPAENAARATDHAAGFLHRLLNGDFSSIAQDLIIEWLRLAERSNQLVPPQLLPMLLDAGAEKSELRESFGRTIGERGSWLSKLNGRWHYVHQAVAADESKWETGELAERVGLLAQLRRTNPDRARELVFSTWKDEPPDERAAIIQKFEIGLSSADEDFLEQTLVDKRKEVRGTAATLLARIPGSRYVKRLIARAEPLIKFTPGGSSLLKKAKPARIELELPAADDKSLRADVLDAKPPKGIGEKVWIIIQILQLVPLQTWTDKWSTAPEAIVGANSDFKNELLRGWTWAAVSQKNAAWANAVFPHALASKDERVPALLEALNPDAAERHLEDLFEVKSEERRQLQASLLSNLVHPWSAAFSRKVLDWLRKITALESFDWQTRNQLVRFVPRLAPEMLRETMADWPVDSKGWEFWKSGVDDLISAAQFRDEMIRAIDKRI